MKKLLLSGIFCFLLVAHFQLLTAQVPYRFSFEYNEIQPFPGVISDDQHDTLMSRLDWIYSSQGIPRGGININSNGWKTSQPTEASTLNFVNMDLLVAKFNLWGFEAVINVNPNCDWASVNNTVCIDGLGDDDCAPDADHWDEWHDYIVALVERYDADGIGDAPGCTIPVRFYVMPQETWFAGDAQGDVGEALGKGYWDDNVEHLIEVHEQTYAAIHEADPDGSSLVVGSGGWLFDIYSDFPNYPNTEGGLIDQRLAGDNLEGVPFSAGFDSLKKSFNLLCDDAGGMKCDYIGWHPHMGWKSSDQSIKFIREHCNKPIYIDDQWTIMFTDHQPWVPHDGYTQFLSGDSIEGDFPNPVFSNFVNLYDQLNAEDPTSVEWLWAKHARETVKCFATLFGEGVEMAAFSMSNDANPHNPFLYPLSRSWRWSGVVNDIDSNYSNKPVSYTMKLLVDELYDFTSVECILCGYDPYMRIYKFERARGTAVYVMWSEENPNPTDPQIPNGGTWTFPVSSDSMLLINIVTDLSDISPDTFILATPNQMVSIQLGFEPVFLEETSATNSISENQLPFQFLRNYPNPISNNSTISFVLNMPMKIELSVYDMLGRKLKEIITGDFSQGSHSIEMDAKDLSAGHYLLRLSAGDEQLTQFIQVIK